MAQNADDGSEMIEEDYYDEEDPNSKIIKSPQDEDRKSYNVDDDEDPSSGGAGDDQAVPAFENLPSVRSRITDQSYDLPQSSYRGQDSSAKKLTATALLALNGAKNNKAKDFENLPSMRSDSVASSSKDRGFNQV
jgi:hypothetical protein